MPAAVRGGSADDRFGRRAAWFADWSGFGIVFAFCDFALPILPRSPVLSFPWSDCRRVKIAGGPTRSRLPVGSPRVRLPSRASGARLRRGPVVA